MFAANFVDIFCADFGHIFLKILTRLKKVCAKSAWKLAQKSAQESTYELALNRRMNMEVFAKVELGLRRSVGGVFSFGVAGLSFDV